jgi:hypothetical protein
MGAEQSVRFIIGVGCESGVWNSKTSPLHGETGDVTPRIIIVAVIAKQSWQEGSGQGHFDSLKFRSDVLGDSLDELPFLKRPISKVTR